jgi:beta-N-acetylhexosaminidase
VSRTGDLARGVVMTGFPGTDVDAAPPHMGGYVLFSGNASSVCDMRALTDALRARSDDGRSPLIAIDQEGGRVARLTDGVEAMPSMMALGAAGDLELAGRAGEQIAFDLRRAGCTLDFAPVLDLALDPRNTVIGTRSFGDDPQQVAALGAAVARGLQAGGVLPCYKHFPGHGATSVDSHEALPVIDDAESVLRARDLAPFAAVAHDAPAMMSAHVLARAFDFERAAAFSFPIATDLLRGELGFSGAFITDCLEMKAAGTSSTDQAVAALLAGVDLLLFSHFPERAVAAAAAIEAAVNDEHIPLERLEQAYARVCRLRDAVAAPLPLDGFSPHPGVGREIGRRAITLLRGLPHADPIASITVSFGGDGQMLEREAPALENVCGAIDPAADEIGTLLAAIDQSQRRPVVFARRAHLHPGQAQAIRAVVDRSPDALVVSLLEPFDLPLFPGARHLLAAYGDDCASIGGVADVLFGGSMPTGRLPVALPY